MDYLSKIQQHLETLHSRGTGVADAVRGLDVLLAAHRDALPPQLVHYLVQRSYDKALLWVGEIASASGDGMSGDKNTGGVAGAKGREGGTLSRPLPPPGGCSGRSER